MTVYVIPHPLQFTWRQWADTTAGYNPAFGQYVNSAMAWKDYASSLLLLVPQAPRPDGFTTWQGWADALKAALVS